MELLEIIDKLVLNLRSKVENIKLKKRHVYTLDELSKLSFDNIEQLLKDYKITDIANKLDIMYKYYYFTKQDQMIKNMFSSSISNYVVKFEKILDEIINKIKLYNNNLDNEIDKLKNICDKLLKIKEIIINTYDYSNDSINKTFDILEELNFDEVTCKLVPAITDYFLNLKVKYNSIEIKEDKEEINDNSNNEIIKKTYDILKLYQDEYSKLYIPNLNYDGLNSEELQDVLSLIEDDGYELITFKWLISIYFNEILNNNNYSYYEALEKVTGLYKQSLEYKLEIEDKINKLYSLLGTIDLNHGYINSVKIYLSSIDIDKLFMINYEKYKEISTNLTNYLEAIEKFVNNNIDRKPISKLENFILFAYSKNNQPYFMEDLFDSKHNMIDNRQFSNNEYLKELGNLILDLFEYGEPSYTKFIDSKSSTGIDRVITHIYYPTKKGIVDRGNPTDMWRIRPNLSSNARFVDVKVVIPANTVIHKQVKSIINKYLPHIKIDDLKEFTFIVNIGAALKKADVELYSESIKRYDYVGIDILKLFYEKGRYHKKDKCVIKSQLTSEEYILLDKYVSDSIKTLNDLQDRNIDFNFSTLLGGKYGLSK